MWNDRQAIEVFHLLFLRALAAHTDPAHYALKGGCNLRFFFNSIRYSEDMDLDVRTVAVATLRNRVQRILESPAFVQTLRAQRITIVGIAAPKQTQTTQRWKLRLHTGNDPHEVPTRIEFSRRRFDPDVAHEAVNVELIRRYRLYPVLARHYTLESAFRQKLDALALRQETQARDLFDLKLLLDSGARPVMSATLRHVLPAAIVNAQRIGYDHFASQVLAYLEPEYQRHYRPRRAWQEIQGNVLQALEAIAP